MGWVDAPISGGPDGIAERRLAIMAGGSDEDPARVEPVLREVGRVVHVGGSADSRILQVQGARMIGRSYTPGARATIMLKDLRLISELADAVGLELPHVARTIALYEELVARGDGALDASALDELRLA